MTTLITAAKETKEILAGRRPLQFTRYVSELLTGAKYLCEGAANESTLKSGFH